MAQDLGDRLEDSTIDFTFHTNSVLGVPTTLSGSPVVSVYKANGLTQTTVGVTLTPDFDSVTGLNHVRIDTSLDAFYAVDNDYSVVITTGTVDSVSVVGYTLKTFSIENRLHSTIADILADTNELQGDWVNGGRLDNILDNRMAESSIDTTAGAVDTVTTNTDMRGTDNAALASVLGALTDAAAAGDPTATDTIMAYLKQAINIFIGTTGVTTFPAEAAPGNNVSLAEVIRAIHADVTGLNGDAMRGTDNAALASVLGALADAAAGGDPTSADTVMQYVKQLINTLVGTAGVVTYPAAAAPGNAVSLAEIIRAIYDDSDELQGDWVEAGRLDAILDARASQTTVDAIETDTQDIQSRLPAALVGGRMDSDVEAINNDTEAADDLQKSVKTVVSGAAIAGTLSTTQMTTDLTEPTDDHYNGRIIIWTTGDLKDQATDITDYTGATKLLTYTAVTDAPSATDTFVIV